MLHRRGLLGGLGALCVGAGQGARASEPALTAIREGGAVLLIRHARAPGTGDPPGFRLEDCATQRNLSEEGRRQAAGLGQFLRDLGARVEAVRSSRWCRALDTARLAFPHLAPEPDPALDSFFGDRPSADPRTEAARATMGAWRGRNGLLALVTHQVNITALTQVFPGEGEIVVVRPGRTGLEVLGRVAPANPGRR